FALKPTGGWAERLRRPGRRRGCRPGPGPLSPLTRCSEAKSRTWLALGQGECQCGGSGPLARGPPGARHRCPWQDRRMDDAALTKLLQPEGWGLLNAMPPYEEKLAMAMSSSLRDKGVDPD